jgi:hypothetical protein
MTGDCFLPHQHQQDHKAQATEVKPRPAEAQPAPESAETESWSAMPSAWGSAVPVSRLMSLQGSIGNAAVGRMLQARGVATAERPTPVSAGTQRAIESQRGDGEVLDSELRGEMETLTGAGMDGVRLHSGPPADALTRSLGANAFTQGRDVFLSAGRDPSTHAGRATLGHEATHVAQGSPSAGSASVMMEPATDTAAPSAAPPAGPAAAPSGALPGVHADAQPGATMGPEDGEVRIVERLPTIGEPGVRYIVQPPEKRYNMTFTLYHKPVTTPELTAEGITKRLTSIWYMYHNDLDMGRAEHDRVRANREEHWIAGFWSDTFGGVELPETDMWSEVGRGPLADAKQAIDASDEVLKARWEEGEASIQRNLSPGLENNYYMQQALAFDATEERIDLAVRHLEEARRQIMDCERRLEEYREGTVKGAQRAITGINVSIMVLSAAAGGGGAGFAGKGAGLIARGGTSAVTTGFVGAAHETFTQVGEMRMGTREDWDFDFGKIAKRGAKDLVSGFVGAVIGGKMTNSLQNKMAGWVTGMSDETLAMYNMSRANMLTNGEKLFVEWVSGVGSSPFQTATNALMDRALEGEWKIKSADDFFGLVWDDMVTSGAMGGFMTYGSAAMAKVSPGSGGGATTGEGGGEATTTTTSEGGGGATTTTTSEGGTPVRTTQEGGGGSMTTSTPESAPSSGVPEHIGPEGDAPLSPDVSTGVPEPIGPGFEPTLPQDSGTSEPAVTGTATEPVSSPSDGVPEHIGPEGDADLSPDVSTGIPEPIGPGYEPTKPQGDATEPTVTGTEPTEPVASNEGVPEHVGSEGDAYYSPDASKNERSGPTHKAQNGNGGGGRGEGGNGNGPGRRDTLPGMGAAGPAGENAPPRPAAADTTPMPAQQEPRRFSETSELAQPIDRAPENRMSVSGYEGSLPEGYGVFRTPVRLESGDVVDAVVKIYPGEMAGRFNSEVAGAKAAARTGQGPEFYGEVEVPTDAQYARKGTNDLAFAMEPIEGAFAATGSEPGQPGHQQAVAESAAAAARIGDHTIQDVRNFGDSILEQGYYYGGSHGGEVQGLIGPNGEWRPIDFQGLNKLPPEENAAARAEALREHEVWVQDEVNNLERSRREREGFPEEDPTQP